MKVMMMSLLMLLLAGGNAEAKKYKPAPRTAKNIVNRAPRILEYAGGVRKLDQGDRQRHEFRYLRQRVRHQLYGRRFDRGGTRFEASRGEGSRHPGIDLDKVRNTLLGNGEKVPTLREYLLAGKSDPSTQLILEIKKHPTPERENEIVAKTMAMVEELGLEKRVEYISFSWNICEQIHKADRKAVVYYLNGEKSPAELKKAGMNGLDYT